MHPKNIFKQNKKLFYILGGVALVAIVAGAMYFSRGTLFRGAAEDGFVPNPDLFRPIVNVAPPGAIIVEPVKVAPPGGSIVEPVKVAPPGGSIVEPPPKPSLTCKGSPDPALTKNTVTWEATPVNINDSKEDLFYRWELPGAADVNPADAVSSTFSSYQTQHKSVTAKYATGTTTATATPWLRIARRFKSDDYLAGTPCTIKLTDFTLEAITEQSATVPPETPYRGAITDSVATMPATPSSAPIVPGSFTVAPTTIYPKDSAKSTSTRIGFKLAEDGIKGSLKIFSGTTPIIVKTIEEDNTLFSKGASAGYFWYGDDDKRVTVKSGIYAIVLDITTSSGGSYTDEKYVTVVAPPAPPVTPPGPPSPPETPTAPPDEPTVPVVVCSNIEIEKTPIINGESQLSAKVFFSDRGKYPVEVVWDDLGGRGIFNPSSERHSSADAFKTTYKTSKNSATIRARVNKVGRGADTSRTCATGISFTITKSTDLSRPAVPGTPASPNIPVLPGLPVAPVLPTIPILPNVPAAPAVPPTAAPASPNIPALPGPPASQFEPAYFDVYPTSISSGSDNNRSIKMVFRFYKDTNVTLKILDNFGVTVKNIEQNKLTGGVTHERYWSGNYNNGKPLPNGRYIVRMDMISSSGHVSEVTRTVYIENPRAQNLPPVYLPPVSRTETVITTITPAASACADFKDVPQTNSLCPALQYAKEQGIFSGYPDGTFRPYDVIKRAEAVKVILTAFKKTILADAGFRLYLDTESGTWYSPYLRTGRAFGIEGYPDGTFRPGQQVNKVELLKMFFNTSGRYIRVRLDEKPYADVPVDTNTLWYLKYVQFAKDYALIATSKEGFFYPAAGIQRGDVAELFYRYHLAGLDK